MLPSTPFLLTITPASAPPSPASSSSTHLDAAANDTTQPSGSDDLVVSTPSPAFQSVKYYAASAAKWGLWGIDVVIDGVLESFAIPQLAKEVKPVIKATCATGKFVTVSVAKTAKLAETKFIDPKKDVESSLPRLEAAHSREFRDLCSWIADFVVKEGFKFIDKKPFVETIANVIGKERISDTLKSNLLNALANLVEKANCFDHAELPLARPQDPPEPLEIEEVDDGRGVLLLDSSDDDAPALEADIQSEEAVAEPSSLAIQPEPLALVKPNPFKMIIRVFEECVLAHRDELRSISTQKMQAEIDYELAQARLHALHEYSNSNPHAMHLIKRSAQAELARREIIRSLADASLVQLQEAEIRFVEKVRSTKAALDTACQNRDLAIDRQARLDAIKAARDEWACAKAELEGIRAFISGDAKVLETYALKAARAQVDLEMIAIIETRSQVNIEKAQQDFEKLVRDAQGRIDQLVKNREKVFQRKVGPSILSILFPDGPSSIHIYHPNIAVYPIQELVWDKIVQEAPAYLFAFLPFILQVDRPVQEARLNQKTYAPLVREGLDLFANDLLNEVFEFLKLPEEHNATLKEFIKPYIEYVGIHAINTFAELNQDSILKMIELIGETRSQLSGKSREASVNIIVGAFNAAFDLLPEESRRKLFGLPALVTEPIKKMVIFKAATFIMERLYPLVMGLSEQTITLPNGNDAIAGTTVKVSDISQAIRKIVDFQLDRQLDPEIRTSNGYSKIVNLVTKFLAKTVQKQEERFAIAGFIKRLLNERTFSPLLDGAFGIMRSDTAYPLKLQLIELTNPLIVNFAVKGLAPILEKERNGGKQFDEELLMAVLPFATDYLHQLNQSAPSTLRSEIESNRLTAGQFYKNKADQLLALFLPNGVASLKELFPDISDQDLQTVWALTGEMPASLAMIKDHVFDAEVVRDICISIYESTLETFREVPAAPALDAPPPVAPELTPEEIGRQNQMDSQLEGLFYEAAILAGLPVDRGLRIARFVPGNQIIKAKVIHAIRASIQKQFNGRLIEKNVEKGLKSQQNKLKTRKPANYYQEKIDRLERQLIREGILYGLRSASNAIKKALEVLDYPVVKQVKDAVVALTTFMMVRVTGGLLRWTGMDEWMINKLYQLFQRKRIEFQGGFAHPEKHEAATLEVIEAVERVLERDWAPRD